MRRRSQVVRRGSAKPLYSGSIPLVASRRYAPTHHAVRMPLKRLQRRYFALMWSLCNSFQSERNGSLLPRKRAGTNGNSAATDPSLSPGRAAHRSLWQRAGDGHVPAFNLETLGSPAPQRGSPFSLGRGRYAYSSEGPNCARVSLKGEGWSLPHTRLRSID